MIPTDENATTETAANASANATPPNPYPLASDANGEPLTVPSNAVAWRVRKLARKAGRPKLIFDPETGRPIEVPINASFQDFVDCLSESGRYRLEAIDALGRAIPGCVGVTEVVFDDDDRGPASSGKAETP